MSHQKINKHAHTHTFVYLWGSSFICTALCSVFTYSYLPFNSKPLQFSKYAMLFIPSYLCRWKFHWLLCPYPIPAYWHISFKIQLKSFLTTNPERFHLWNFCLIFSVCFRVWLVLYSPAIPGVSYCTTIHWINKWKFELYPKGCHKLIKS